MHVGYGVASGAKIVLQAESHTAMNVVMNIMFAMYLERLNVEPFSIMPAFLNPYPVSLEIFDL